MAQASTPSDLPTDETIAEAARRTLNLQVGAIYLSRLGQDLRTEFGPAFKLALGSRSLGDFVTERLGDRFEVWGKGPYKRVGLHGSAALDVAPKPRLKYLELVWNAFSNPLDDAERRWIDPGPPLTVKEAPEAPSEKAVEVASDFIVGNESNRRERTLAIASSIQRWAEANDIPLSKLENETRPEPLAPSPPRAASVDGLEALRRLIAAIPARDRAQFSLPMNLRGQLLQVS